MKRYRWLPILVAVVVALGSCSRKASGPAQAGSGNTPASPAETNRALRGSFVFGADQAALRAYLENVREVKPSKFDVEWSKDVVAVSREEAMRALRAASADGSAFIFTTADPVVQKLQPGKIIWIWGIAIRRIDRLGVFEDGTVVHTSPVPLSEAMTRADIEFATPVDFGSAYGVYNPRVKQPPPRTVTRADAAGGLVPVRYAAAADPPSGDSGGAPLTDPGNETIEQTAESDKVAATSDGYAGNVAGFDFSMGYRVSQGTLHLELQAKKEEEKGGASGSEESQELHEDAADKFHEYVEEQWHAQQEARKSFDRVEHLETQIAQIESVKAGKGGGDAQLSAMKPQALNSLQSEDEAQKLTAISDYRHAETQAEEARAKARAASERNEALLQLFQIVSDNLDVRFRARADLNRAALSAAIKLQGGSNAGTTVNFSDLKGSLDLELVARLGKGGNGGVSIPVAHVPVRFNIPLIVYGVPLVLQVGADFLAKVALGGNHAAHHFHAKFQFAGSAGTQVTTDSQTNSNAAFDDEPAEVEPPTLSSPGVSGTVLAVQIPRLGLGVGSFVAAAVAYVDQVVVVTMTNSAAVATLNPPCTRVTVDRIAHVGADVTTLLPIPFAEQLLKALSWNKEVWRAKQWIRVDPDIKMCRI